MSAYESVNLRNQYTAMKTVVSLICRCGFSAVISIVH